jgi:hypothetical protein
VSLAFGIRNYAIIIRYLPNISHLQIFVLWYLGGAQGWQWQKMTIAWSPWKQIASALNREVRTVQMWEKHEGLPVHPFPQQAQHGFCLPG